VSLQIYADLTQFNIDDLNKDVYDMSHAFFYLCLLPPDKKRQVLSSLSGEAFSTYESILYVKDTFCSDPRDADAFAIPPHKYYETWEEYAGRYKSHIEELKQYGKPILLFLSWDTGVPIRFKSYEQFRLFRASSVRQLETKYTFGLPTFTADYFDGTYLNKKLSVAYCGCPYNHPHKRKMVDIMKQYDYFDYIVRDTWNGGSRKEFIDNMNRNLYSFVIRGDGNFSFRLAETYMMGRIPVFINTEGILPFEDHIPYKDTMVYVPNIESDVDMILRSWHDNHTEQQILDIQRQNRVIWENYFRPHTAYYATLQTATRQVAKDQVCPTI